VSGVKPVVNDLQVVASAKQAAVKARAIPGVRAVKDDLHLAPATPA
jgi:osmotically-inducible protein OsmY